MFIREVTKDEKEEFNKIVSHPLQSWEWGNFREKTGLKVIRLGCFEKNSLVSGYQLTFHPLPFLPFSVGYLPKGTLPDKALLNSLVKIGNAQNCLFIKLEPNLEQNPSLHNFFLSHGLRPGRPLFTKNTFQIDLTLSEEELLKRMREKTRYNVRLAQKHGVIVREDNSPAAFETYLKLTKETASRQKFFAHNEKYHRLMWEVLQPSGLAHLLIASYQGKVLVAWILFLFKEILYYPYGASSSEDREVMASNLIMWEAMRWGKAKGARLFDLWGALGPNPNPQDPWFGFHRFKESYGGKLVEFLGTYDLVLNSPLYPLYNLAENWRWKILRLKSRLSMT